MNSLLESVLQNEIINSKTYPAAEKKRYSKNDLDYLVKFWFCPYILDTPDAEDKADKPDDK